MAHDHSHSHGTEDLSDRRLVFAIALNLLLTVVEAVAGVLAGSLALLADALHNFNDVGSLIIALVARRIGRLPSDDRRTFGYRRAEIIGALINLTILVLVGLYLVYEAIGRFFQPQEIDGWIVVIVATVALIIDVATAALLFAMSRGNLNLRAAYLHNLGDALSSVGVIVAGAAFLWFGAKWADPTITLVIAGFILWQSLAMMGRSIHILMQGAPADVELGELVAALQSIPGVVDIHHVHVWELDEEHRSLEAHVVVNEVHLARWTEIKREIKRRLADQFHIHHSTVEFESPDEAACEPCHSTQQHRC
jgi:cobalt-zinc-cadmium efflux system protein